MKKWWKKVTLFIAAAAAALGIGIGVPDSPTPQPTPVPTVAPTTAPTPPTPTPVPTAQPSPEPTVAPTTPPTSPPPGYPVHLVAREDLYLIAHRYNAGVDVGTRIRNNRAVCETLHHVPVPSGDCNLFSDLWDDATMTQYIIDVMGGCPVFQYQEGNTWVPCHNNQNARHSCDHFGNTRDRDDPQTPGVFEGQPFQCGEQSNEFGPNAGFFTQPQKGEGAFVIRACHPDGLNCSGGLEVTWR